MFSEPSHETDYGSYDTKGKDTVYVAMYEYEVVYREGGIGSHYKINC